MADPNENYSRYSISKNYIFDANNREIIDKRNRRYPYDDINTKIKIYEDRVNGWFFEIADKLKRNSHAGFVILMIATSYLESNQQFREGRSSENRDSSSFVRKALKRIFPDLDDDVIEMILNQVRHGFFHDGTTRSDIFISASTPEVFQREETKLLINPHLFLEHIKSDFSGYILELKNTSNEDKRTKFRIYWDDFKRL